MNADLYAERITDAMFEIAEVRAADPNAVCPTPAQLIACEDAGLIWNFATGRADEANPHADAQQIRRIAQTK